MLRFAKTLAVVLGVGCLGLLGGCGQGGPARHEVTGKITYAGEAIEDGLIDFESIDGTSVKQGAQIVKGEYKIPREKGLPAGKYKVSIHAGPEPSAKKDELPGPTGIQRNVEERAGPEYNEKSTLTFEVKEGETNQFNFDVPKRKT
jgi:hypothetical protein